MRYYGGGMSFKIGATYVVMGGQVERGDKGLALVTGLRIPPETGRLVHANRYMTKPVPDNVMERYVVVKDGEVELKTGQVAETVEVNGEELPRLIVELYRLHQPQKKPDVESRE